MSVEQITAVRYKCKCDHADCAHKWEADIIPDRCAKCKKPTWNRPSIRFGRNGKKITAFGKSQTIAAWGREYKISRVTLAARIRNGWTHEDAIKIPVHVKEK